MSAPAHEVRLSRDRFGRLELALPEGGSVAGVVPVRCFPFSDPGGPLALCDERGTELRLLPALSALEPETRALIEEELGRTEFVPVVRRIRDITAEAEASVWQVETDRGDTALTLPSEDHIRRLGEQGAMLSDARGIRFRILDIRKLDRHSRRLLMRYL